MVKLGAQQIERYLAAPGDSYFAVLVYGPDRGLVKERLNRLETAILGAADDPFRRVVLNESVFSDDGGRLLVERAEIAFGGGRRVIHVVDASDRSAAAVARAADGTGDGLILLQGGDLGPRSKLRKACEVHEGIAVIPCYGDDHRALAGVLQSALEREGLAIDADARTLMLQNLGQDRSITRQEIEKLLLFKASAPGTEISVEDVLACVAEGGGAEIRDLVSTVTAGDFSRVPGLMNAALAEGGSSVGLLRALQRHFQRLHQATAAMAAGLSAEQAVAGLKPPVFFKDKPGFVRALGIWSDARLVEGMTLLVEAERACKSGRGSDRDICERAVLRLTRLTRTASTRKNKP